MRCVRDAFPAPTASLLQRALREHGFELQHALYCDVIEPEDDVVWTDFCPCGRAFASVRCTSTPWSKRLPQF